MAKSDLGISVTKEQDVNEWYTQLVTKGELIEYSKVSGCYILRPRAYAMWESIQQFFDKMIKADGVKNVYFPLFIPESLLTKEAEHVEGFTPEVAWVTHHGEKKMAERLAIRPTSETIMYDTYKKWIRSHRDLPLRLNQWCNVVRWEFKHPQPFLRSREFLWQEGHTAFATQKQAADEVLKILEMYRKVCEDLLAIPVWKGKKSEKEKFAGANYSTSLETFLPIGKAIQGATSHQLGQNFAKAFGISFTDKDGKKQHPWQNSWGLSTRLIGVMLLMHSDNRGIVLPPKITPTQVIITPILFDKTKDVVLKAVDQLRKELKTFRVEVDDRTHVSAGFRFADAELKGIPLRIDVGPRDLEKGKVVIVRRDTGDKEEVAIDKVLRYVKETLVDMQNGLFDKAKKFIDSSVVKASSLDEIKKAVDTGKCVLAPWSGDATCEDKLKEFGAKTLNIPFDQQKVEGKCAISGEAAKEWVYIAKSL